MKSRTGSKRSFSVTILQTESIPDEANLREAATGAGLNAANAMEAVASKSEQDAVWREAEQSSRMGNSGVPYFFVNGKPMGSGAQPPEAFLQAFERA